MAIITREEVLKLAELSKIEIVDEEIDNIRQQLEDVLNYAASVQEIAKDIQIDFHKNINVFAKDVIFETDYKPIMEQAPMVENNFFVVPKVLEDK